MVWIKSPKVYYHHHSYANTPSLYVVFALPWNVCTYIHPLITLTCCPSAMATDDVRSFDSDRFIAPFCMGFRRCKDHNKPTLIAHRFTPTTPRWCSVFIRLSISTDRIPNITADPIYMNVVVESVEFTIIIIFCRSNRCNLRRAKPTCQTDCKGFFSINMLLQMQAWSHIKTILTKTSSKTTKRNGHRCVCIGYYHSKYADREAQLWLQ